MNDPKWPIPEGVLLYSCAGSLGFGGPIGSRGTCSATGGRAADE